MSPQLVRAPVVIFKPHDVVFAQVAATLHFNQTQRRLAEVFRAVHMGHHPVFGMVVHLWRGFFWGRIGCLLFAQQQVFDEFDLCFGLQQFFLHQLLPVGGFLLLCLEFLQALL